MNADAKHTDQPQGPFTIDCDENDGHVWIEDKNGEVVDLSDACDLLNTKPAPVEGVQELDERERLIQAEQRRMAVGELRRVLWRLYFKALDSAETYNQAEDIGAAYKKCIFILEKLGVKFGD